MHGGIDLEFTTIGRLVEWSAARHAEREYLHYLPDGFRMTYADTERLSRRFANGLHAMGIGKGSHVAVMMGNRPDHALALLALARIGALAAMVNTAAKGDLLRHFLSLARADTILLDREFAPRLEPLLDRLPQLRRSVLAGAGEAAVPRLENRELADLWDGSEQRLEDGIAPTDPAQIIFTSGTTGPSKGVLYNHAKSVLYAYDIARSFELSQSDRLYCWMPLFHASGMQGGLLSTMMQGASVALAPRFSASAFMREVRASGSTVILHQGATLNMVAAQPPGPQDRDHRLRFGLCVPAPASAEEFRSRFGIPFTSAFGMTDCGMPTWLAADAPSDRQRSCGRAGNGWEVAIMREDGTLAAPGETGEICMRNAVAAANSAVYFDNPAATAASWKNGWFLTGDRGRLDADGYLWHAGRLKDSIRRRGENISSFEVEQAIAGHPAVADAAVYAVASEMSEDEVAAAIVLHPGRAASEAELAAHCAEALPRYMVPRYFSIVAELPRNLSQRVQKFVLTERANRDLAALWDREKHAIPAQAGARR